MKPHYNNLIKIWISLLTALVLSSCIRLMTSKMPRSGVSMQQTYNAALNGTAVSDNTNSLEAVRGRVRVTATRHTYSNNLRLIKTSGNTLDNQFARLPNPNIVMYVYPHTAGNGFNQAPIPGYTTVFPLYLQVHYAMPGEVIAY